MYRSVDLGVKNKLKKKTVYIITSGGREEECEEDSQGDNDDHLADGGILELGHHPRQPFPCSVPTDPDSDSPDDLGAEWIGVGRWCL